MERMVDDSDGNRLASVRVFRERPKEDMREKEYGGFKGGSERKE